MALVGTVHAVPMPASPSKITDTKPPGGIDSKDIEFPIMTPMIPIITSTKVTPGNYSSVHYPVPTVSGSAHSEPVAGNYTGQVPKITGPSNNGTRPDIPLLTPTSTKTVTVTVPFPTDLSWEAPFPNGNMTIQPVIGQELSTGFSLAQPTTALGSTDNTAGYIPTEIPSSALIHDHGRPPVRTSFSAVPNSPTPAEPLSPIFTAPPFRGSPTADENNSSVPTGTSPFAHEMDKPLLNPTPANGSDVESRQQVHTPEEIAVRPGVVPYRRWCWRSELPKGNTTLEDKMKHLFCKDKPIMNSFEDVLDYVRELQEEIEEGRKEIDEAREKGTADEEDKDEDDEVTDSRAAIIPSRRWCWRWEIPEGNTTIEDKMMHMLCKDKPIMDSFEDILDYVREL